MVSELCRSVPNELLAVPLRPFAIAASLKVEVVPKMDVGASGQLVRGANGYAIVLDQRDGKTRQRFTMAHELGHLMLDRLGHPLAEQARTQRYESACNRFAEALLMPPSLLEQYSSTPSTTTTLDLSRAARVSVSTAFIALTRHLGWRASLATGRWDRLSRRWRVLSVRSSAPFDGNVVVHGRCWERLPADGSGAVAVDSMIELWGRAARFPAEAVIDSGRASMVVDLTRAEQLARRLQARAESHG
jgi:hypothetical protein